MIPAIIKFTSHEYNIRKDFIDFKILLLLMINFVWINHSLFNAGSHVRLVGWLE